MGFYYRRVRTLLPNIFQTVSDSGCQKLSGEIVTVIKRAIKQQHQTIMRACFQCNQSKNTSEFSKAQRRKGENARCALVLMRKWRNHCLGQRNLLPRHQWNNLVWRENLLSRRGPPKRRPRGKRWFVHYARYLGQLRFFPRRNGKRTWRPGATIARHP